MEVFAQRGCFSGRQKRAELNLNPFSILKILIQHCDSVYLCNQVFHHWFCCNVNKLQVGGHLFKVFSSRGIVAWQEHKRRFWENESLELTIHNHMRFLWYTSCGVTIWYSVSYLGKEENIIRTSDLTTPSPQQDGNSLQSSKFNHYQFNHHLLVFDSSCGWIGSSNQQNL